MLSLAGVGASTPGTCREHVKFDRQPGQCDTNGCDDRNCSNDYEHAPTMHGA